jgi:hypothetical protein
LANSSAQAFNLNGQDASLLAPVLGVVGASRVFDDGTFTYMVYERRLVTAVAGVATGTLAVGQPTKLIYSVSSKDALGLHDIAYGFVSVNLGGPYCNCGLQGSCAPGTTTCSCFKGFTGTSCELCTATGTAVDPATGQCGAAPAAQGAAAQFSALTGSAASGPLTLRWSLSADGKTVTFGVKGKTAGWIGLAFSGAMVSGHTAVCSVQNGVGSVVDYAVTARDSSAIKPITPAISTFVAAEESSGETTCIFSRPLAGGPVPLAASGSTAIAFALASSDSITVKHTSTGSLVVNLSTGSGRADTSREKKIIAHGVMMALGWGVAIPVGALVARMLRHLGPVWFQAHRGIQSAGLVLVIVGFGIALGTAKQHFQSGHAILGLIVILLGLLQPLNALFRPHPGTPNRWLFNLAHLGTGYSALILSLINVFLGLKLANAVKGLVILAIVWYSLVVLSFLIGQFVLVPKRPTIKPPHPPAQATPSNTQELGPQPATTHDSVSN